jgi:hypothetical protein
MTPHLRIDGRSGLPSRDRERCRRGSKANVAKGIACQHPLRLRTPPEGLQLPLGGSRETLP